jgi:hypothetical protein
MVARLHIQISVKQKSTNLFERLGGAFAEMY